MNACCVTFPCVLPSQPNEMRTICLFNFIWFCFLFFCLFLILDVFKTILEKSITCDYDAVCKLWIGPKLIVFLFNPADVELILSSHVFIDKSAEYRFFKPWLGDGLLISTGNSTFNPHYFHSPFSFLLKPKKYISFISHNKKGHKWRSHRKLIAPTFHLNVLKSFIDLFNENSRQVVRKLELEIGKTFDAHDHMSEATVEILLGKFHDAFSGSGRPSLCCSLHTPFSHFVHSPCSRCR